MTTWSYGRTRESLCREPQPRCGNLRSHAASSGAGSCENESDCGEAIRSHGEKMICRMLALPKLEDAAEHFDSCYLRVWSESPGPDRFQL